MSTDDNNQKLVSYFEEKARRQTFTSWPFESNQKCSADKMAEAGFIFTGSSDEPDSAECFFCQKSLDCWEPDDDPWNEHLKHAGQCKFAKMQKGQNKWTAAEWFELYSQYRKDLIKRYYDNCRKKIQERFANIRAEFCQEE